MKTLIAVALLVSLAFASMSLASGMMFDFIGGGGPNHLPSILLESGSYILLESGDTILLE
jgi:hypothetical protein